MTVVVKCILLLRSLVKLQCRGQFAKFPDLNCGTSCRNWLSSPFARRGMASEAKIMKPGVLKIGTHNGNFHCDEALACFMLKQLEKYKNAEIVRTRDLAILNGCDIVVDVGNIFDVHKNRFDHHQKSFQETLSSLRPELGSKYIIRLSSAGLIFAYFGREVISAVLSSVDVNIEAESLDVVYRKVYENLIEEIDAIDNGVPICDETPKYKIHTHLSARIGKLAPAWNCRETVDENQLFSKAMTIAGEEFLSTVVYYSTAWLPARDIVKESLENAGKVHHSLAIIELSKFCPWKEHFADLEEELSLAGRTKYVLFEDKGAWRVICVPITPSSFICRKFLHKEWRGLRGIEIKQMSKIQDADFCHMTGFIGGALSREGALEMAIKSLEGDYED